MGTIHSSSFRSLTLHSFRISNTMNTARILRLQPLRQAATAFKQPVRQPLLRLQARPFHQTRTVLRSKEEDHSAHTITQRLRNLKRIPPELLPLGVVIAYVSGLQIPDPSQLTNPPTVSRFLQQPSPWPASCSPTKP